MKRIIAGILVVITLMSGITVFADSTKEEEIIVDLVVNSNFIRKGNESILSNGTPYVVLRTLCHALGYYIGVENDMVSIYVGPKHITIPLGTCNVSVAGEAVDFGAAVIFANDRYYVSPHFINTVFEATANYDSTYFIVEVTKNGYSVPEGMIDRSYTKDDIFWMGRIIQAEAGGEPVLGKVAVGNVVMNRVKSGSYPNTIYGVIFDHKNGVQYTPTINGAIYNTPSRDSIASAKRAICGEKVVGDSLFFINPRTCASNWVKNNRRHYKTIANHAFYL